MEDDPEILMLSSQDTLEVIGWAIMAGSNMLGAMESEEGSVDYQKLVAALTAAIPDSLAPTIISNAQEFRARRGPYDDLVAQFVEELEALPTAEDKE